MKALVLSDSHGRTENLSAALEREKDCELVFFLGDGEEDLERVRPRFKDRKFIAKRGNNDYFSTFDDFAYKYVDGNTVVACHGHTLGVKRSLLPLIEKAESVRANVALYGHTHRTGCYYDRLSDIYVINPGALCSGSYAVLKLEKGAVDVQFKNIFA